MTKHRFILVLLSALFLVTGCSDGGDNSPTSQTSQPNTPTMKDKGKDLYLFRTNDDYPYHREKGVTQVYLTQGFCESTLALSDKLKTETFFAIRSAIEDFNEISSKYKFKLECETDDFVSYGVNRGVKEYNAATVTLESWDWSSLSQEEQFTRYTNTIGEQGLIGSTQISFNVTGFFSKYDSYFEYGDDKPANTARAYTFVKYCLLGALGYKPTQKLNGLVTMMGDNIHRYQDYTPDYDVWSIQQYNYEFGGGVKPDEFIPWPYYVSYKSSTNNTYLGQDPENEDALSIESFALEQGSHIWFNARKGGPGDIEMVGNTSQYVEYTYDETFGTYSHTEFTVKVSGTFKISITKRTHRLTMTLLS